MVVVLWDCDVALHDNVVDDRDYGCNYDSNDDGDDVHSTTRA